MKVTRLVTRVEVDDSIADPRRLSATASHEIADTARVVVGPDEPFAGYSQEDMEASHWNALATVLRRQGINVEGPALRELPHDVVLGKQLLARLRASAG